MSKPKKEHWKDVKRMFMYLCGTTNHAICYQERARLDKVLDVHGFIDVDWDGGLDHRIFTRGYVFNLFGGAISWMSKKYDIVVLSYIEAKYMEATHASKDVVWSYRLCLEIRFKQQDVRIDCDSQSKIFLKKNPTYHSKTKHIDV